MECIILKNHFIPYTEGREETSLKLICFLPSYCGMNLSMEYVIYKFVVQWEL